MAKALRCHHCGRLHVSNLGGDLYCSPACRDEFAKRYAESEAALMTCGFQPVAGILNLWEKGGVHISLDQVIREGLHQTIGRHADALADR